MTLILLGAIIVGAWKGIVILMSCPFYEFRSTLFGGDYYCIKKEEYMNSDIYYKYCRDYSYSDCPIYKHQTSSGCFITTVVCDILGKSDNYELLNRFRYFRDNTLQKDVKYSELLKIYDTVGQFVADDIYNDEDRYNNAKCIYEYGIKPIDKLIEQKKYDEACERYYVMTLGLVNYYGLKHAYNRFSDDNFGYDQGEFDIKNSGHGKVRKLLKEDIDM